ncbi:hypothetical protein HAX54_046166 [Datura stramonium]|uniref:Uncharacterized protein n=1 Tax=Datura stramonium TaxID=4076 RepID=A0ABS8SRR7_DATST|nr:hypothetical protein [Datura stramonium]
MRELFKIKLDENGKENKGGFVWFLGRAISDGGGFGWCWSGKEKVRVERIAMDLVAEAAASAAIRWKRGEGGDGAGRLVDAGKSDGEKKNGEES